MVAAYSGKNWPRGKKWSHYTELYLDFETEFMSLISQQMKKFWLNRANFKRTDREKILNLGKKTNWKHKFHLDFGLDLYIFRFFPPFPSVTSRSKIIWLYNSQASLRKVGVTPYVIKQIWSVRTVCQVGSLIKNLPAWLQYCMKTKKKKDKTTGGREQAGPEDQGKNSSYNKSLFTHHHFYSYFFICVLNSHLLLKYLLLR